ncbi:DUF2334 domain-containing protein [Pedobacter mucosus]|uniref:DUF2334 domain-containing protein n=1 Tax=Pedobacter mucosus TaxID=2895286 RepID=UPI001EE480E0|nr:DUF2334 domain-containing protein [Pedobacter mucosus]UKT65933.1 DUF2334 domain-containing protein [Pedobacter mucosus]
MIRKFGLIFLMLASISVLAQPKIVLKLDDVGANKVSGNKADQTMAYLLQMNVKASYGVVAKWLDETALSLLGRYINAKNAKGEAMVEIWHHGYDHSNSNPPSKNMEYKGTSYELQKKNFNLGDSLVRKYLGLQMHTFGAPFNAVDSTTLRVVAENKNYHILYCFPENTDSEKQLTRLNFRIKMENGTGKTNLQYFLDECEKNNAFSSAYMVLQGHPPQWNVSQFEEFKKIVAYLIEKNCEFVLPSELK